MTKPIAEQVGELKVGETWLPVPEFPDYLVSDRGNIRSLKGGGDRLLKPVIDNGYPTVVLHIKGKGFSWYVHRLVMFTFIGPAPQGIEVRHLNGVRTDNRLENLKYGTRKENVADMILHGRHNEASKTECVNGHPFDSSNTRFTKRPNGWANRVCKTCQKEYMRLYWLRQKEANK